MKKEKLMRLTKLFVIPILATIVAGSIAATILFNLLDHSYYVFVVSVIIFVVLVTNYLVLSLTFYFPFKEMEEAIATFDPTTSTYQKPRKNVSVFADSFEALEHLSLYINRVNNEVLKEKELVYQESVTDFLTKLPNRRLMFEILNKKVDANDDFSLMLFSIHDFGNLNREHGTFCGDAIIKETARRLGTKANIDVFVSRYESAHFTIIANSTSKIDINKFLKSICDMFNEPIIVGDKEIEIKLSIGISLFPEHGNTTEKLFNNVTKALNKSRRLKEHNFVYYDNFFENEMINELSTKRAIENSIDNKDFKVLLQPQVNIHTNEVVSLEALARFENFNISPNDFILVAEKYNLMKDLGKVIISNAVSALRKFRDEGKNLKTIYVNLTSSEINDLTIIDHMKNEMDKHFIKYEYLGVEVSERTLIKYGKENIDFFNKLNKEGFKLAIDDFGSVTGSIKHLIDYPLDLIKIDKLFSLVYLNEEKLNVYESIINLATDLSIDVIAEGIEALSEIDLLKKTKLKLVQGYYYYKPMEVEKILEII